METDPDSSDLPEHPGRVVWALAWPAVALNSMQVINTLLDRTFLGSLPSSALKAAAGCMTMQFLLFSIAMSISIGATALVSRAYGAGANRELRKAARQSLSLSLLISLGVLALGAFISPIWARQLFPNNPDVQLAMTQFMHIYLMGLPAIYGLQILAGSLRGVGDTKSPMVISGIQIGLHIILNFLFIFPARTVNGISVPGLNMALNGSAWALTVSAFLAFFGYMFYMRRTPVGSMWAIERPEKEWSQRILKIANPSVGMSILRVASLSAIQSILTGVPYSEAAIAAIPIGFSIESIMFMPAFGFSMAATTLVGQSLGMKKPERARKLAWLSGHYAAAVVLSLVVPIYAFAPSIATAMIDNSKRPAVHLAERTTTGAQPSAAVADEGGRGTGPGVVRSAGDKAQIIEESVLLIRLLCLTELLFCYNMVLTGAMQGAGDSIRPFWITVITLWVFRVPSAYLLALPLKMGAPGAYISLAATQAVGGGLAIYYFIQGKWKTISVGVGEKQV